MGFETSAVGLWKSLSREDRLAAARSIWNQAGAAEAIAELSRLWHARPQAILRAPLEQRASALAGLARPPEGLADSLLVALHLAARRPLLCAFLDGLGIPHEEGLIAEDTPIELPAPERLVALGQELLARFGPDALCLYWNTLWLQDRGRWDPLEAAWEGLVPAREALAPGAPAPAESAGTS